MRCYLIGAGNNSKVIIDFLLETNNNVLGIFDDNINKKFNYKNIKILDKIENINLFNLESNNFFNTIGDAKIRGKIMDKIKIKLNFPNFIHATSYISNTVKFGRGNIIYPFTCIQSGAIINNHNLINMGTTIGHDVIIGDNNVISPQVSICGNIIIKNNNFFGSKSVIIPKIKIGSNNIIGSATNIIRNISDNLKIVGNPNRKL